MKYEPFMSSLKTTDEEYVHSSDLFTLYQANLTNQTGKLLSIIFPEKNSEDLMFQISPRIRLKLAYCKNDVKGLTLTTYNNGLKKGEILLSSFTLSHIIEFLEILKALNIAELSQRKISLKLDSDNNPKTSITNLITKSLISTDQAELIQNFLEEGLISDRDLVNTGYRKLALQKFEKLLNDKEYIQIYKRDNNLDKSNLEKVWQHFFETNEWIFGYGLDYKFQAILQREVHLNTPCLDQTNAVLADFLLGDKKFTTFVEIKRPDTQLFAKSLNRSGCWRLSSDLYDAHSQILEHKACGQIKLQMGSVNYNNNGETIAQNSYDSKTILIIGNWSEIDTDNKKNQEIKKKTFELFRQNSKNVEIITFDELYDRAKFIVDHHQ
ncbi:Shedu immune nuclease family protein [Acinetobacter pseudolwoffii]|uniref:Shedu immune nuclease family protein n=1 Tax=Acinetobacter pseudolwoffii TaxID=2053287 RepID=UPI00132F981B